MAGKSALCPWCGNRADSVEHILPRWMAEQIPGVPVVVEVYSDFNETNLVRRWEPELIELTVPVCDSCNKWMNDTFEKPAKRWLIHMMNGNQLPLTAERQQAVADWALMKSLLWPHYSGNAEFVQEKWLRDFRSQHRYPSRTTVWVACIAGEYSFRAAPVRLRLKNEARPEESFDGYLFTFGVKHLALQVAIFGEVDALPAPDDPEADSIVIPIWPLRFDRIDWPPEWWISAETFVRLPRRFSSPSHANTNSR